MKSIKLIALSIITASALVFTSCSLEESVLATDAPSNQLLKSFTVKKDVNGAYSLDFDLNQGATVDKVYDDYTNTSQFLLYSSNSNGKKQITEGVEITDSQLKLGIIDTNTDEKPSITITDDNISFGKGNSEALKSYEIKSMDDGTYQLDFTVKKNISVDFVYNDNLETYEVHLDKGKNKETSYSRTFEKEEGKALRIDFLNFYKVRKAKSDEALMVERKPKIIIDE